MAIFLKWQNYAPRTDNRVLADLFYSLSPQWYPTNIIANDPTYHILKMIGNELASASVEAGQVIADLSLSGVRTSPVEGQSTSKIYDNFGRLVGVDKFFDQDYEIFTSGSVDLMSYRQELRLLFASYFAGSSYEGIQLAGRAFTGIAPVCITSLTQYPGWVLTRYSGSVVAVGTNFVVLDQVIPRIGRIINTPSASVFVPGTPYVLSYTKLGTNTIVRDEEAVYSGNDVIIYTNATNTSFKSALEGALTKAFRADVAPRFFYSSHYVGYHTNGPLGVGSASMTYSDVVASGSNIKAYAESGFEVTSLGDYITNTSSVNGKTIYGRPIHILSTLYPNDNWYYDWTALTYNDAHYTFGVRQYTTGSIPPTVYFQDYNTSSLQYLSLPSNASGVDWIFDSSGSIQDISGNRANLPLTSTASPSASILGRSETWLGQAIDHTKGLYTIRYSATTGSVLNFTNTFTCEAWVTGIDNISTGDNIAVRIRRETSGVAGTALSHNGYMFSILPSTSLLTLSVYTGGNLFSTSVSIASLVSELPSRYHYFAASYNVGSVLFYCDDVFLGSGSLPTPIPTLSASTFTSVELDSTPSAANSYIVGIDEVVLSSAVLTPDMAKERFEISKPRLTRLSVPAYDIKQYHQPRWKVWASGSTEFELHHFSIRGLDYVQQHIFDKKTAAVLEFPLFKAPSGSF
jgi:hypothetical protein